MMYRLKRYILDHMSEEDLKGALIRKKYLSRFPVGEPEKTLLEMKNYSMAKMAETYRKSFRDTVANIEIFARGAESNDETIRILESCRKIVSYDLTYTYGSAFRLFAEKRLPGSSFPSFYIDEDGREHEVECKKTSVDIKGKFIVESPYKTALDAKKYTEALPHYYPELNLILQGNRSIHVLETDRTLQVYKHNDSVLYDHISSNGAFWLNKYTGEKLGTNMDSAIYDFRLAVIFRLRQVERSLLSQKKY